MTFETPQKALPYSSSCVSISGDGLENMVTLLAWEHGSPLYRRQKFQVHLQSTGLEYETTKMARVNHGLQVGSALSSG
jgi:hypothetical protein